MNAAAAAHVDAPQRLPQQSLMVDALAGSVVEALLGLKVGSTGHDAANRFSVEGLAFGPERDDILALGIRRLEAASLRFSSGPLVLDVGRLAVHEIVGQVRIGEGGPRLDSMEAAGAELSGVEIHGPLSFPQGSQRDSPSSEIHASAPARVDTASGDAPAPPWSLAPLAAANGTIRAEIVDAHLMFDADVTVPIRQGQIDFNETTVEHVGPDSSMGVSRRGLYVDAPNGRSYVYQFSSAPVAGVEFEQRGALGRMHRGKLRLQSFGEALLLERPDEAGLGFTEQARLLFQRTAVSGDVQLSDGRFATPVLEAEFVGRASDCNAMRLESKAVGRELTLEMAALCVRDAVLKARDARLACNEITGRIMLRVVGNGTRLGFAFDVPSMKISGLRLHSRSAQAV
jgi:hypothetical protein